MADGFVARKTNSASEFGAGFDTFADFIFMAIALIKLLPVFYIPIWLRIWVTIVALIKINNLAFGFVRKRKLLSLHTGLSRITGLLLFLLPFSISFFKSEYTLPVICFVAPIAAIHECISEFM